MPKGILAQQLLLPSMKLFKVKRGPRGADREVPMVSHFEVCPKCATKRFSVYDRRWVVVKDAPLRGARARFGVSTSGLA